MGRYQFHLESLFSFGQQYIRRDYFSIKSNIWMLHNLSRKQQEKGGKKPVGKVVGGKKGTSSHHRAFEEAYAEIIHRKDNDFFTLESSHLDQQIDDLRPVFNDHFRASLGSSPSATPIAIERKRYIKIKQKIESSMQESSQISYKSMKDLFAHKQQVLTGFLNDFANQISRQCKQKGDILKYIWNTMINMIENISENVATHMKEKEKYELENNLKSHLEYQSLIDTYQKKQIHLIEKNRQERVTINSLVYELRFKRKQIHKLYRNQKMLINKINEYKADNLNLQGSYIDVISSFKDVPQEKIDLLLKAREQIDKSKQVKFKVGNRKISKNQIKLELTNVKLDQLESLYQEIKEIANSQVNSPQLVSTLIQASIENFGLKNDDPTIIEEKMVHLAHKHPKKIHAQTQFDLFELRDRKKTSVNTQLGYQEHLAHQLIENKNTQTYCQYPKRKIFSQAATQVQVLQTNLFVAKRFDIHRSYEETIVHKVEIEEIPQIKIRLISEKHHKKHYSDVYINGTSQNMDQLHDFIDEKVGDNASQQSIEEEITIKRNVDKKRTKLKKSSNRFLNSNGGVKERYNSIISNSSIKVSKSSSLLESVQAAKQSHFAALASRQQNQKKSTKMDNKNQLQLSEAKYTINSRQSIRKGIVPKFKGGSYEISKNNFLQKNNYFNIQIDPQKQSFINRLFMSNEFDEFQLEQQQMKKILDNINLHLEKINNVNMHHTNQNTPKNEDKLGHFRRNSGLSAAKSSKSKSPSENVKYNDENELLLNLCRSNYYKNHKKIKQKIAIYKYHDEFTNVKDKINFIAKDVKELIAKKQSTLKKTINPKNLKNIYKILMMTFSKAYNSYNKGILKGNLIYPLFESFSLVYGAINSKEVYKKMINFIAALTLARENPILRFFLFFLGLDELSPYSEKVTVSQVYLCLKLLESISVDGKVTLNIQSIYTDTVHIKQQLINILKEEKIPEVLSKNIENRVTEQLQNSNLFQKSASQNFHLKLNIYNIILLIIQQVIKCKASLEETFAPILARFDQYQQNKKLPSYLIQVLLSDRKFSNFDPAKLKALTDIITNNGKRDTITSQQFCSILFEHNIVSIDQLYQKSQFIYKRNWKIPQSFVEELQYKTKHRKYRSALEKKEVQMFLRISSNCDGRQSVQENPIVQKMKRLIFQKHYERKVDSALIQTLGGDLQLLVVDSNKLTQK